MPIYCEQRRTDLPCDRVFDLVADVEHYPEFLPSWQQAVVCGRGDDGYDTEQTIGFGLLARRFRTHTVLQRPSRILVSSEDSVFRRFAIRWEFTPTEDGGSRIELTLDFDVASWALAPTLEILMAPTAAAMVTAFERRARTLATRPPDATVH